MLAALSLTTAVATLGAGLASFLAPCTLPLIPAYLGAVSGVAAEDLAPQRIHSAAPLRARLLGGSVLYVAGFTIVFVLLGLGAGGIGFELTQARRPLEIGGGIAMVVFGLALTGLFRIPLLERTVRIDISGLAARRGTRAALPIGMLFGLGWTPCVGPYLGSALTLAAIGGTAWQGAVLLGLYSLGLGLPFIVVALLYGSVPGLPQRLSRLAPVAALVGGVLTATFGLLIATGAYTHLTSWLAQFSTPS
jgi:cytochrome c-type biogenesis protein